jgi:hypothetical protein
VTLQGKALTDGGETETRTAAETTKDTFSGKYGSKYEKAATYLTKNCAH